MTLPDNYFIKINSDEFIQFEKEIAFFYFAKNTQNIAKHYIQATTKFEQAKNKQVDINELQKVTTPDLAQAYLAVQQETHLTFDLNKAAILEFNLIYSQSIQDDFEHLKQIMIDLYKIIFKTDNSHVTKAAMLRTFLYQYKTTATFEKQRLSKNDIILLKSIAKSSEEELANLF